MHHDIVPKRGLSVDYDRPFIADLPQRSRHHARGASPHRAVRAGHAGSHAALGQRRRARACRRRVDPSASAVCSRADLQVRDGRLAGLRQCRSQRRGPRMAKLDESRPFIPVRIAVLTVSDTRSRRGRQVRRLRWPSMIAAAGHEVAAQAIVKDDVPGDPRPGAGLDRRCRRRRRDHHRRHRLHRPRRDARGRQAAVREGDRRLLDRLPHDLVRKDRRPRPSSRGPAPASPRAPTSSACRARPGPARTPGTSILKWQLDNRHRPCNFVEIMPRLEEHRRGK